MNAPTAILRGFIRTVTLTVLLEDRLRLSGRYDINLLVLCTDMLHHLCVRTASSAHSRSVEAPDLRGTGAHHLKMMQYAPLKPLRCHPYTYPYFAGIRIKAGICGKKLYLRHLCKTFDTKKNIALY